MICISGFEQYLVSGFSLLKQFNTHSVCKFDINIGDTDHTLFFEKVNNSIEINNGRDYLFFGYIKSVTAEIRYSETILHVCAVSNSAKIDREPHYRLYQDPDKKLSDILKYFKVETGSRLTCGNDLKITEPIIQSGETDFMFLVRMALLTKQNLIINDSDPAETVGIVIANELPDSVMNIETEPDKLSVKAESNGDGSPTQTVVQFTLHDCYIEVGKKIKLRKTGFVGCVVRNEIVLEREAILYRYTACEPDFVQEIPDVKTPQDVVIEAVVEDNQHPDGMCCIKARATGLYKDAFPDNLMWIPYQVPYLAEKAGAVFLPDKGDFVNLVFRERSLTAQASVGKYQLDRQLREKQNHYVSSIFGKQVVFREGSVEIRSGKSTISVGDSAISLKTGETEIVLSDRAIELKTGAFGVRGDEALIKVSGDVKLKGSKIYLK